MRTNTTKIDPASLKQQVSLTHLLSRLGHEPAKQTGQETLYHSPLRKPERTPSFSVNDHLGAWYDHGLGKGGNLIDLGLALWPELGFKAVLAKLYEVSQQTLPQVTPRPAGTRRRKALRLPHYQVETIKPLGSTPAISQYLQYRGVDTVAPDYLEEVHYYVRDEKNQLKHFFAAGHRNESGGWEVRNKYFKGCLGRKGLTILAGDPRKVALFEGLFDFLSWKYEHSEATDSIIILNSVSLLQSAIKVAIRYPEIETYFDHDPAGWEATRAIQKALPYATDRSEVFKGCHDYNNKRKKDAKTARLAAQPPKTDFMSAIVVPFIR